jgi:hypothetical protein
LLHRTKFPTSWSLLTSSRSPVEDQFEPPPPSVIKRHRRGCSSSSFNLLNVHSSYIPLQQPIYPHNAHLPSHLRRLLLPTPPPRPTHNSPPHIQRKPLLLPWQPLQDHLQRLQNPCLGLSLLACTALDSPGSRLLRPPRHLRRHHHKPLPMRRERHKPILGRRQERARHRRPGVLVLVHAGIDT